MATFAEGEAKKIVEATKLAMEEAQKLAEESKKIMLASKEGEERSRSLGRYG